MLRGNERKSKERLRASIGEWEEERKEFMEEREIRRSRKVKNGI